MNAYETYQQADEPTPSGETTVAEPEDTVMVEVEVPASRLDEFIETIVRSAVADCASVNINRSTDKEPAQTDKKKERWGGRRDRKRGRLNVQLHPDMLDHIEREIDGKDSDKSNFTRGAIAWAVSRSQEELAEIMQGEAENQYLRELAAPPRGPKTRFSARLTIMAKTETVSTVDSIADTYGTNRSSAVRRILAAYLQNAS